MDSYQVPKEVGKIGTESPTFVQPVKDRKDGIQAMFAKQQKPQPQLTAASSTADPTPPRPERVRKRSASPADLKPPGTTGESQTKKLKVEKLNTWEDDSDVEYVDDPPAAGRSAAGGGEDRKARLHVCTSSRRLLIFPASCSQQSAALSTPKRSNNHPAKDTHNETPPKVSRLPYRVTMNPSWSRSLTSMFAVTGTERGI